MMSTQNWSVAKRGLVVLTALVIGVLFTFPSFLSGAEAAAPANQIVWRLDFYLPKGDPETIMIQQACDEILEFTEGRLKIDVYPSFSLKLNPRTQ